MSLLIGVTSAWSNETWGEEASNPQGYIYTDKAYAEVVYRSGAVPFLLAPPLEAVAVEELPQVITAMADQVSGLIFTGGGSARRFKPDNMPTLQEQQPLRYRFEAHLIKEAWRRRMPVLGFCRGHQMIAAVLGGEMRIESISGHQQKPDTRSAHSVDLLPGSRLAGLMEADKWEVNSYHCQVVAAAPPGFQVCARSPEGWVEAMEAAGPFWFGFQFHPEMMFDDDKKARRLFQSFIKAADAYSR